MADTFGLILAVVAMAANVQDRNGAKLLVAIRRQQFSPLWLIWADQSHAGELMTKVLALQHWRKVCPEIVKRPAEAQGFQLPPKWGIVERTLGWLGRYSRLSQNH